MSVIELIGFIITMIVFFLLILKQGRDQRRRREHPEEFEGEEREKQEAMQELMESLHIRPESQGPSAHPPPPPPRLEEEAESPVEVEEVATLPLVGVADAVFRDFYADKESLAQALQSRSDEAYRRKKEQKSRVKNTLKELDSLKEGVIIREILGPPKGM